MWDRAEFDLDAYLRSIGVASVPAPSLDALRSLHRAHVTAIPFENLSLIAGRTVSTDIDDVQRKLVADRRGGYCFEHATLFAAALSRIGFRFSAVRGRVTLGSRDIRPATHALLLVEFDDGSRHLCDVGFGRGPLEPLPLVAGDVSVQEGWRFRLTDATDSGGDAVLRPERWTLWHHAGRWVDRHVFTLDPAFPVDFAVGNHYVATAERSPFRARTFVQRFTPDEHHVLDGTSWTRTTPDGEETVRQVAPADIPGLLSDVFDIVLDPGDGAAVVAAETRRGRRATG
ncbi:arylamine N-acetyltransferase family protein [Gordonia shandongensis]|uniref:arylamine N-acetyltransferase family protein n=1 Tax=Gordonia shandongensis TaxID=376351 RepID=UPI000416CAAA|nr:arylamine N-acetyltransferase [Gordonia shandongensis]